MVKVEDSSIMMKIEKEDIVPLFSPLSNDIHKGNLGQLIIIGGSKNYVGAPLLAEMGASAMRVGCGLNILAVPKFLLQALRERVLTSSLFSLSDNDESVVFDSDEMFELSKKATAFALGMGFGNGEADKIANYILTNTSANLVVDADGLSTVCKNIPDLKNRTVLTPHIGEFAKIVGLTVEEVLKNSVALATEFAKKRKCVLVLKSHRSIITDGSCVWLNTTGNAKLAKGGSGDVLAGIIGGLLARGISPLESAKAGCYILGRCAEISDVNEYSHLASDTVAMIPIVLDELTQKK
ncbi:MAG: NAD(P)H-hydrate dehydratase [Clostridia bacterium]|nr:NAD(P)H-hydrate dehydratase [Clostridia bacterium]